MGYQFTFQWEKKKFGWSQFFPYLDYRLYRLFCSVQFSCSVISNTLWPHEPQHTRRPCPSPTSRAIQTHVYWAGNAIQLSHLSFPSPPVFNLSQHQSLQMSQLFASGVQSIRVSASASVLPMNIQDWFPLGWNGLNPCSPRDSQESSPTAQSKSISASVLNLLYGTALTSMPDYWKNHSFE